MEEVHERIVSEPYGFVYITTNMVNGKKYLGQRKFDSYGGWKYYLGSGTILHDAIKKYGKDNFSKKIIHICYSPEELNKSEYELSVFLNVVESDDFYNLIYGGTAHFGEENPMFGVSPKQRMDEETYQQWLDKIIYNATGENNPMYGRSHSDETKEKIRQQLTGKFVGDNNSFYGHKHTEESRKKMSELHKGRVANDVTRKKMKEQRTGRNNYNAHPLYCYELDEFFWGSKDVKDKYPHVPIVNMQLACRNPNRSCGKHPVTGEPLHWKHIAKQEYEEYIKNNDLKGE